MNTKLCGHNFFLAMFYSSTDGHFSCVREVQSSRAHSLHFYHLRCPRSASLNWLWLARWHSSLENEFSIIINHLSLLVFISNCTNMLGISDFVKTNTGTRWQHVRPMIMAPWSSDHVLWKFNWNRIKFNWKSITFIISVVFAPKCLKFYGFFLGAIRFL